MKVIGRGLTGMGIAYLFTNIFMILGLHGETVESVIMTHIVWMVAGALFGILSIIYDAKNINPLLQKGIHFAACYGILIIGIQILYPVNMVIILMASIIFVVTYMGIYIGFYIYEKKHLEALNDKLSSRKRN